MRLPRFAWPLLAVLLVVLGFAPALPGPFVLDDHANLAAVYGWVNGDVSYFDALVGDSGPLGRPLSYATLMLNAVLGGDRAWGYKGFNLLLHLACAALVYAVLLRVLRQVDLRGHRAAGMALLLAVLWAVHPLQVSTVAYVVQRMTLLATLAQLAALWVFLEGRGALASDPRRGRALLFLAFPALTLLGLLAKETAALVPLLACVLEFGLFRDTTRPRALRAWLALFVFAPLLLALLAAPLLGQFVANGYEAREFTLEQRLLTQPRILGDYLLSWLWPSDLRLGLYRDGYPHSTGILQPLSTLAWIGAWGAIALLAWWRRARQPLVVVGVCWFLAGHALESSFIALEPYYEHRNYLPSLGLWLAATGLLLAWWPPRHERLLAPAGIALALVLATLAAQRAWHWGDTDRLLAAEGPPSGEISRRLQIDRAIRAFQSQDAAREQEALAVLANGSPGDRAASALWSAIFACDRGAPLAEEARARLLAAEPPVPTHSHLTWLAMLAARVARGDCPYLRPADLDPVVDRWQRSPRGLGPYQRGRLDGIARTLHPEEATPPP